jgi:hypothetical protein
VSTPEFSKARRQFLQFLGAGATAVLTVRHLCAAGNGKKIVKIVQFDAAGVRTGVTEMEKVEKPAAEWRPPMNADERGSDFVSGECSFTAGHDAMRNWDTCSTTIRHY